MFSAVFCTLSAALMLLGANSKGVVHRHRSSDRLMFDHSVFVLACLTYTSLKYRAAYPCMHLKFKKQNLELDPFPDGQPVKIF